MVVNKWKNSKQVLFVPDMNLGAYVASMLPDIEVIRYPGYCPTHMRILPEDVIAQKELHPNAKILCHPECDRSVVEMADVVGSTTALIKYASESDEKEFIIVYAVPFPRRSPRAVRVWRCLI